MLATLPLLLAEQIQDLYSAETQLIEALPRMAKASTSEKLRKAFESHLKETKGQVKRLEQVAKLMEITLVGKECKVMEGLLQEGNEAMQRDAAGEVRDIAIIAVAQKVEHYEMAAYGTARTLAVTLESSQIAALLKATLDEETSADEVLKTLSTREILLPALEASGDKTISKEEA